MREANDTRSEVANQDSVAPTWNLGDLYCSPDSPELEADLEHARAESETFHASYADNLSALSGAELGKAIESYEKICERAHKAVSYAQLVFAENMGDPERGRFRRISGSVTTPFPWKRCFLGSVSIASMKTSLLNN